MANNVNRTVEYPAGVGVKDWMILDANPFGNTAYVLEITGTVTATLQVTLVRVKTETEVVPASQVVDVLNATDLTISQGGVIQNTPLSAVRINQTVGTGSVRCLNG